MASRLPPAALALLVCACTFQVSEEQFIRPVAGGSLRPQAIAQSAPAYTLGEHWIETADGARLNAVLLRQTGARMTVLYFGGNQFTVERFGAAVAAVFAPMGVDLMIVDHRGYGRSEGRPTQANMEADGIAAFDYLSRTVGVRADRIIVHGQSLGSFIAGRVGAERPAGGVVLESSATTTEDWVDANLRGAARLVARAEIDEALRGRGNLPNMPRIEEPLLILVGSEDRTTPPRLSQALYDASTLPPERRTLVIAQGAGHNDALRSRQALAAYRDFLAALAGGR